MSELREVLKELTVIPSLGHFTFHSDRERYIEDKMEDTVKDIRSLILAKMPKDKTLGCICGGIECECGADEDIGYNSALVEMRKIVEGL